MESVSISTVPPSAQAVGSQKKLKFLLVSTHCQQYTGYSKVSWGILKELAKNPWLSITHFGFQKFPQQQFQSGYRSYPSNVRVIDAASLERPFEQGFGCGDIVIVARRDQQLYRATLGVDTRVDFRREPTARAADGLVETPFLSAPALCWWALTMVASIMPSITFGTAKPPSGPEPASSDLTSGSIARVSPTDTACSHNTGPLGRVG